MNVSHLQCLLQAIKNWRWVEPRNKSRNDYVQGGGGGGTKRLEDGDGDDLASQTLAVFLLHVDNGNDCEIKKVWLAKMQEGWHVSLMNPLLISSINWYLI